MTALTDELADQLHAERTRALRARGALAFVRGALTVWPADKPLTQAIRDALLKECNDVLEPPGSTEPKGTAP